MSKYNAALQRQINAEVVAVDLFGRATDRGVAITRVWIDAELDRLRDHSPTCRCPEPCQLAHGVTGYRVHWVARCWTVSTAATERLARR